MVMEALFDAADEDRGTGGVDILRGIYPTIKDATKDGITDVPPDRIRAVYEQIVRDRDRGEAA
jgi:proteasome beta subunit